jgi:host factor-I protein
MLVQEQRHSMKDILDSTADKLMPDSLTDEQDNFANRKLIRPALPRVDPNNGNGNHNSNHGANHNSAQLQVAERRDRHERPERSLERGHDLRGNDLRGHDHRGNDRGHDRGERSGGGGAGKKTAPPDQTNAETFYYQKQMQSRTPMVVVLQDGEEVHGIIEWYDKTCIKVNRDDGQPNLMSYKPAIKYMFKEEERKR